MSVMRMSHLLVKAPHGLKSNTQPRDPKRIGEAIKEPGILAEVRKYLCREGHVVHLLKLDI